MWIPVHWIHPVGSEVIVHSSKLSNFHFTILSPSNILATPVTPTAWSSAPAWSFWHIENISSSKSLLENAALCASWNCGKWKLCNLLSCKFYTGFHCRHRLSLYFSHSLNLCRCFYLSGFLIPSLSILSIYMYVCM